MKRCAFCGKPRRLASVTEALAAMPDYARDAWLHGTATIRLHIPPETEHE